MTSMEKHWGPPMERYSEHNSTMEKDWAQKGGKHLDWHWGLSTEKHWDQQKVMHWGIQ